MEKRLIGKSLVVLGILAFFVAFSYVFLNGLSITGQVVYSPDLTLGLFDDTYHNGSSILLSGDNVSGSYESDVFNATADASWNSISWDSSELGELPNNAQGSLMNENVLLMHLNEGSGTISDMSGEGNDATYTGTLYSQVGKLNTALGFDGSGDYVNIPDNDGLSFGDSSNDRAYSISAWFKADNFDSHSGLVGKWNAHVSKDEYLVYLNDQGQVRFIMRDSSNHKDISVVSDVLKADIWYNFIAVYDGSSDANGMKLYINGAENYSIDKNEASYVAMENSDRNPMIGFFKGGDGSMYYLDGLIDEVAIGVCLL